MNNKCKSKVLFCIKTDI